MLPPDSTATDRGPVRRRRRRAAPRRRRRRPARRPSWPARPGRAARRDIDSSETVTISSTYSRTAAKVSVARQPDRDAVGHRLHLRRSGTGQPCRSDSGYAAASLACTPTTRTSGRSDFTAIAMPASRPPPPVGTSTVCRSRRLLDDLQPGGALAGDDVDVVERVDQHRPGLGLERPRRDQRVLEVAAVRRRRRRRTPGSPSPSGSARPRA